MSTFLITSHLRSSFQRIGACIRALPRASWRAASAAPRRISIRDDAFELTLPPTAHAVVLDCRKDERHLVLSIQDQGATAERFLCGFDERHWFAAAVTGGSVPAAKDSLMPPAVREAALRAGVRQADLHRRHTKGFIRQGEWFFVPAGEIDDRHFTIHWREPLIRPGGGKAHVVDELVRGQGEMVWHHVQFAWNGVRDAEFQGLPEWQRDAKGWSRRTRVSEGMSVFARGSVRHPDHATIVLSGWHRVYLNSEVRPASLGFLD